jgi:hypothetical protein
MCCLTSCERIKMNRECADTIISDWNKTYVIILTEIVMLVSSQHKL